MIADPRRRAGHRVGDDGTIWFDDDADSYEDSREEAIEENDPDVVVEASGAPTGAREGNGSETGATNGAGRSGAPVGGRDEE